MARLKGTRNKKNLEPVIASNMTTEERIQYLANLIIDRIIEDQNNGGVVYKKLTRT